MAVPAPTRMSAGDGDDLYVVDNAGDVVLAGRGHGHGAIVGRADAGGQRREPDAHGEPPIDRDRQCHGQRDHRQRRQPAVGWTQDTGAATTRSTVAPATTRSMGRGRRHHDRWHWRRQVSRRRCRRRRCWKRCRARTRCSPQSHSRWSVDLETLTLTGTADMAGTGKPRIGQWHDRAATPEGVAATTRCPAATATTPWMAVPATTRSMAVTATTSCKVARATTRSMAARARTG